MSAAVRLIWPVRASRRSPGISPLAELLLFSIPRYELKGATPTGDVRCDHRSARMTSCGYGVPVMKFVRHRRTLDRGRRFKTAVPAPAAVG
jgi:hypothetical protein